MKHKDYSLQEIEDMLERIETFEGTRVNFGKLQLFQEIKEDAIAFLRSCEEVHKVTFEKPNRFQRNADVYIDLGCVSIFDKSEIASLFSLLQKADTVVLSSLKGETRITLGIKDIWTDKEEN